VRETLDTLLKVYPMRSCTQGIFDRAKRSGRPCLLGDIGKCAAPCVGRVDSTEHRAITKQFIDFMGGSDTKMVAELKSKMLQASDDQNYEYAARLRDDIVALEAVLAKSAVVFTDQTDADLFAIAHDDLSAAVSQFIVRGGRIRGVRGWVLDKELERDLPELVEYILQNVYESPEGAEPIEVPREVLVPELPEDKSELAKWLGERRGSKVDLRVPQRGDKAALAKTALTNAKHSLLLYKSRRTADFTARADALSALQRALNLPEAPLRIECFDISHLSGTNVVASMVVFEDGLPKKDQYRHFAIEETTDDTDSIYQVLMRRLKYLAEPEATEGGTKPARFAYRPNLLIVDGGQPQVNAAARALRDSGVSDLAVVGIAKRLEELWLPEDPFPVILPRGADELFMVQRLRDEAHRFAISYQRKKRSGSISSQLSEINGLGEKRVTALLKRFGSAKRLKQATLDEISEVAGIGPILAQQIIDAIGE
jgi:excinuclease ABC subunit C